MSRYAELLEQQRRLLILRTLRDSTTYSASTSLLADVFQDGGAPSSRAQLETSVGWLEEVGLVACRDLGSVRMVTVTDRGLDVAAGRSVVPGVKRPSPTDG